MHTRMPTCLKVAFLVLLILSLQLVLSIPELIFRPTAIGIGHVSSVALVLIGAFLIAKGKVPGKWCLGLGLFVAYCIHSVFALAEMEAGASSLNAGMVGAAMFEVVLLFSFIWLLGDILFGREVRGYLASRASNAAGSS